MFSLKGKNPTELYYKAIKAVIETGDEVSPRGKKVKELRPAAVEFENPYNRITFLGSRRVNPFFQIAESLWILSGRADVKWLTQFNANMGQFSDDGRWFNAPYGERIRLWGKNSAHNFVINPVDQMVDVYTKILNDKDTRQAVIVISNPHFDNSSYTIGEKGKDIACNLVITFKVRHDKLNMTVFNRSNDVHWGLWGANLCQFTTIQETMVSWLKNSGNENFINLEIGEYCQLTDSLHIYLDDYGAKETDKVLSYYNTPSKEYSVTADFTCKDEPRMCFNIVEFDEWLSTYWNSLDKLISNDEFLSSPESCKDMLELIKEMKESNAIDDYWEFGVKGMLAYRFVKLGNMQDAFRVLDTMKPCQWKISMLYFLKAFIKKLKGLELEVITAKYKQNEEEIIANLVHPEYESILRAYLKVE